jgi:hypothetical protein
VTKGSKHLRKLSGYLDTGLVFFALFVASIPALATDLNGKVVNGTTRNPAVGDEVVVLNMSNGNMSEGARAKTDGTGHFSLIVADPRAPHMVRVVHQGVPYEKIVEPSVNTVAIQVYDVASKVDGLSAVMDVQRFEASSDTLEVKQLVTIHNASRPPRTLVNDRPFEIQLQPDAQVESGMVQIEDQEPLKQKPAPGEHKDEYYFRSPVRPGDTRFAVVYRLPYNGEAVVEPRILNAQERFVVMLPKSMTFEPKAAGMFRPMPDVSPDNVQGTAPATLGQALAFRISGTGALAELQSSRQRALVNETVNHGGGLARPPKSPSPPPKPSGSSKNHDLFIGAGLTIALACGTVVLYLKKRSARRALEY